MAFSKADRFEPRDFHFSLVCEALSHPARISIVRKLYQEDRCSVGQLNQGMPISPASVSQHLKVLREMHILSCEEHYPTVFYWINTELPATQRTVIDLVLKIDVYFPQTDANEIATVGRMRGPIKPS